MVDKLTLDRRSWNMSRIRSRDTIPEIAVRRLVHGLGFRFRLHNSQLPGRPDLVLARHKIVIFVHGCFWHQRNGCIDCSKPGTNQSYWAPKLARNVERDAVNQSQLISDGWKVITVWECETRQLDVLEKKLVKKLRSAKLTRKKPARENV
jgi:DNA mismatch endonuclease (patch repair protein)